MVAANQDARRSPGSAIEGRRRTRLSIRSLAFIAVHPMTTASRLAQSRRTLLRPLNPLPDSGRDGSSCTRRRRRWSLDLRPFRVVARRLRDQSEWGLNRLQLDTPATGFGPFSRVSALAAKESVSRVDLTSKRTTQD